MTSLPQANTYAIVHRRAATVGIETRFGNYTFRATGITAYLKNSGTLVNAATMANRARTRTNRSYDHYRNDTTLDEVERIRV